MPKIFLTNEAPAITTVSFSLGLVDSFLTSPSTVVASSGASSLVIDSLTWIGLEVGDFPFFDFFFFFFLYLLALSGLPLSGLGLSYPG